MKSVSVDHLLRQPKPSPVGVRETPVFLVIPLDMNGIMVEVVSLVWLLPKTDPTTPPFGLLSLDPCSKRGGRTEKKMLSIPDA